MRVNRAKLVRKWLRFYRIVYGIAPPYAVVLDGNFIHMALKVKMDIKDRLKKLLLGEAFALYIPRAVLAELEALGPAFQPAYEYAKACCEVLENPVIKKDGDKGEEEEEIMSAGDAIRGLIGEKNEKKYMVATQDQELKADLRHVPSVGLLFVSRAVLLMEPPSNTSKATSAKQEGNKFRHLTEEEKELLASIKKKNKGGSSPGGGGGSGSGAGAGAERGGGGGGGGDALEAAAPKMRMKKKAKGPNPLSVKKTNKKGEKKKEKDGKKKGGGGAVARPSTGGGGGGGGGEAAGGKKRKRKKKKKAAGDAGGGGGGGD